jgi:hypothetical protein
MTKVCGVQPSPPINLKKSEKIRLVLDVVAAGLKDVHNPS